MSKKTATPEKKQIFDIFPGVPNERISGLLIPNKLTCEEDGSTVHKFIVPVGKAVVLNPNDPTQEVFFEPIDSKGNFISGLITIYAQTALGGKRERVYCASSEFHNSKRESCLVGDRRKWQAVYRLLPGDCLITKFSGKVIDVKKSFLDHRVSLIDITPEIKFSKKQTELLILGPKYPPDVDKIEINQENKESVIWSFVVPVGNYIAIYPNDKRSNVRIEPRDLNGKLIDGTFSVYVAEVTGERRRLYTGSLTDNPADKMWFVRENILPGRTIEVRILTNQKISLENTKIELRVRVFSVYLGGGN